MFPSRKEKARYMSSLREKITSLFSSTRDEAGRPIFSDKVIEAMTDREGMEIFLVAFTTKEVNPYRNYEISETRGDPYINFYCTKILGSKEVSPYFNDPLLLNQAITYVRGKTFLPFITEAMGLRRFIIRQKPFVLDDEEQQLSWNPEALMSDDHSVMEDILESFFGACVDSLTHLAGSSRQDHGKVLHKLYYLFKSHAMEYVHDLVIDQQLFRRPVFDQIWNKLHGEMLKNVLRISLSETLDSGNKRWKVDTIYNGKIEETIFVNAYNEKYARTLALEDLAQLYESKYDIDMPDEIPLVLEEEKINPPIIPRFKSWASAVIHSLSIGTPAEANIMDDKSLQILDESLAIKYHPTYRNDYIAAIGESLLVIMYMREIYAFIDSHYDMTTRKLGDYKNAMRKKSAFSMPMAEKVFLLTPHLKVSDKIAERMKDPTILSETESVYARGFLGMVGGLYMMLSQNKLVGEPHQVFNSLEKVLYPFIKQRISDIYTSGEYIDHYGELLKRLRSMKVKYDIQRNVLDATQESPARNTTSIYILDRHTRTFVLLGFAEDIKKVDADRKAAQIALEKLDENRGPRRPRDKLQEMVRFLDNNEIQYDIQRGTEQPNKNRPPVHTTHIFIYDDKNNKYVPAGKARRPTSREADAEAARFTMKYFK